MINLLPGGLRRPPISTNIGTHPEAEAWDNVSAALSHWTRVHCGTYHGDRKRSWLPVGEEIVETAIEIIGSPRSWLDEQQRRHQLLLLQESGKARGLVDAVERKGFQSGPYLMSESNWKSNEWLRLASASDDWLTPGLAQSACFADHLITNRGNVVQMEIDLQPLRLLLRLPTPSEHTMLATVPTLPFKAEDATEVDSSLLNLYERIAALFDVEDRGDSWT